MHESLKLYVRPVQFNEHNNEIKMPVGKTYYELHRTNGVNSYSVAELIDSKDDAEFIVRAVNAHDDLLDAAHACLVFLKGLKRNDIIGNTPSFQDRLAAAIAKAEWR